MATYTAGPLEEFVRMGFLDQDDLLLIGKSMGAEMGRRIKSGSGGKTVDGDLIDPDSIGWQETKAAHGHSTEPMVMTGEMTEPDAFITTLQENDDGTAIVNTLDPEHHEKWDSIHTISDDTNRNWDQVWGIGDAEMSIAHIVALDRLKSKLTEAGTPL